MKGKILTIVLLVCILLFTGCSGQDNYNIETQTEIANEFMNDYYNHNYDSILSNYGMTAQIKLAISEELLVKTENDVKIQAGDFVGLIDELTTQEVRDGYNFYVFTAEHKFKNVNWVLAFNSNDELANFTISEMKSNVTHTLSDGLVSEEVSFGREPLNITGELISNSKNNNGKYAIIVSGSGANFRYGDVGPNAIYYNLANELAKNGTNVLIYDKRTSLYPEAFLDDYDINDEVVEDVVFAKEFLCEKYSADSKDIFIIGHSLGGYTIPLIAEDIDGDIGGYIPLCAPSTSISELALYQVEYLADLDGNITDEEKNQIDMFNAYAENISMLDEKNASKYPPQALMNAHANYWLSLEGYAPEQLYDDINERVMFIYGSKDYQVPLYEMDSYKYVLGDNDNIEFVLIDGMTHMLINSTSERPEPKDYNLQTTVNNQLVMIITDFITK